MGKMDAHGADLIAYLTTHGPSTRADIERRVFRSHDAPAFHAVVQRMRHMVGDEVVTCRYEPTRGAYVYACASNAAEGYKYVIARKKKIRNDAKRLVGVLDRIESKYPGDVSVAYARAMMESVVTVLSVGP